MFILLGSTKSAAGRYFFMKRVRVNETYCFIVDELNSYHLQEEFNNSLNLKHLGHPINVGAADEGSVEREQSNC